MYMIVQNALSVNQTITKRRKIMLKKREHFPFVNDITYMYIVR